MKGKIVPKPVGGPVLALEVGSPPDLTPCWEPPHAVAHSSIPEVLWVGPNTDLKFPGPEVACRRSGVCQTWGAGGAHAPKPTHTKAQCTKHGQATPQDLLGAHGPVLVGGDALGAQVNILLGLG